MFVAGEWVSGGEVAEVVNPWSGDVVDTVPIGTAADAERAVDAAVQGAIELGRLTAHERAAILRRAGDLLDTRVEELARLVTAEVGKPITEARAEVGRTPDLLRLCAHEGSQLRGETLPLDAGSNGAGRFGLAVRVPCGVVVAITPFNFPVLLVAHKIGPALAAGNAVILKPASATPLTALWLVELLLEAGVPPLALQCVTGPGAELGSALCADPRVRKVSFTGSTAVGESIAAVAGVKRLSLELGSNCPLVVLADADPGRVAEATVAGGFANAGQVCISTQRVLVDRALYADVVDALVPRVEALPVGDPADAGTRLAAMISQREAERVERWVGEAVQQGARVVCGGQRDGAGHAPTVVADVPETTRLAHDELFGPAVALTPVSGIEEALAVANASSYGLGAGLFTRDLDAALRFAREVQTGTVQINGAPTWRADLMPYGGLKQSGIGREGPRSAVEEMTDVKTIVFHP